jgi:hypothetical protein
MPASLGALLVGAGTIGVGSAWGQSPYSPLPTPAQYVRPPAHCPAPVPMPYMPSPPVKEATPPVPEPKKEAAPPAKEPSTPAPTDASQTSAFDSSAGDTGTGDGGDGLSTADSSVGYIDPAIPANRFRVRYDSAYRNNRPTRAEFFYARGAPFGPGLPLPELEVDYQDLTTYLEVGVNRVFSIFADFPVRFLNPEINANHAGFSDMTAGFKVALYSTEESCLTLQLKTYAPTGDAQKGLGTRHASIEPGFLFYQRLADIMNVEGELRYWIPAGGTNFAGDVIRYGLGFCFGPQPSDGLWVNPVVEFVGWTVIFGDQSVFYPPQTVLVESADGNTIVNAKVGMRFGYGNRADIYFGYGRALTGDVWYKDIYRMEFRLMF